MDVLMCVPLTRIRCFIGIPVIFNVNVENTQIKEAVGNPNTCVIKWLQFLYVRICCMWLLGYLGI